MTTDFTDKICPYCKDKINSDDIVICSKCEMPHHKECWVENQGCTTFGCDGTIQAISNNAENRDFQIVLYDEPAKTETAENTGYIFCGQCGTKMLRSDSFCTNCGSRLNSAGINTYNSAPSPSPAYIPAPMPNNYNNTGYQNINNQPVIQQALNDAYDTEANKGISVLCYFGLFLLIPLLTRPNSKFVKFHANQGMICLIAGIVIGILSNIPVINIFSSIAGIALLIVEIIGIVNCCKGEMKELPIIGKYRILK